MQDLAKRMLQLSREGLVRRGLGEEKYLDCLDAIAESGDTVADVLLRKYYSEWGEKVAPIYSPDFSY